jgi:putative ABC transport system permease protein
VARAGRATLLSLQGEEPGAWRAGEVRLTAGRLLDDADERSAAPVALIGATAAEELFPDGTDPIGRWIVARGVALRVVGVTASEVGGEAGDRADRTVRLPFSTAAAAYGTGALVGTFVLVGADGVSGAAIAGRAREVLAQRHGVPREQRDQLVAFDADRFRQRIHRLFAAIRALTFAVGAATVASGAMGVSNMLVVSVRERAAEIGLRRAVGATRGSVIGLLVGESAALIGAAGAGGLALGAALIGAGRRLVGPDHPWLGQPELAPGAVLALTALLGACGLAAAVAPALHAASLRPADALKREG